MVFMTHLTAVLYAGPRFSAAVSLAPASTLTKGPAQVGRYFGPKVRLQLSTTVSMADSIMVSG
jgi:hypothetical protein